MSNESNLPVAVIGAGISGIAAAHVLKKNGYHVIVFEKSESIGGVWSVAYPNIRLQNISPHYYFAEFPWPFTPDRHPTGEQILRYLNASVEHFQLDVRLQHEVLGLEEQPDGWLLPHLVTWSSRAANTPTGNIVPVFRARINSAARF
jgi:cation diffusion facilitator CzcD-associated flavoprotein CzcO